MSAAIEFAASTDIGLKRLNNEDSYAVLASTDQLSYVVILADGMGGHRKGELASSTAVQYVRDRLSSEIKASMTEREVGHTVEGVVEKANVRVYLRSLDSPDNNGMGTTLTAAVIRRDRMVIGHVGDCRCYILRDSSFIQMTTDHTLVQVLVDRGDLSREQARRHPRKNEVTRALGTPEFVKADIISCGLRGGDRLLFCSDGLHDYVEEREFRKKLAEASTPRQAVSDLIRLANDTAGEDNVTCIVGFVSERRV